MTLIIACWYRNYTVSSSDLQNHQRRKSKYPKRKRRFSLLGVTGKVLTWIIVDRLQPALEPIISESQESFRPGRSTVNMSFTLRQIQEKVNEQHSSLHAVLMNLRKAFDMVGWSTLWRTLGRTTSLWSECLDWCAPSWAARPSLTWPSIQMRVMDDWTEARVWRVMWIRWVRGFEH